MNYLLKKLLCCSGSENNEIFPQRKKSNLIAQGAHGKVYKELLNGKLYACKKFDKRSTYEKELRILKKIQKNKYLQKYKFSCPQKMCIYSNFIPGKDLYYYIQDKCIDLNTHQPTLSDKKIKKIGKHIINGLIELQNFGFVHLDLKLENVIIDKYLNITIIDFDTAQYLFTNISLNILNGFTGTSCYASPEIYENYYTNKSDVWSLGVILWILKTGDYPYIINEDHSNVDKSMINIQSFNKFELINDSEIFLDLLFNIFQKNPANRYSLEDAKKHMYFN